MAESLASKYRPKTFEDVCAQKPIIQILKTQLKNRDFKNALLFCGSSGCGKTTCARIFANEINKELEQIDLEIKDEQQLTADDKKYKESYKKKLVRYKKFFKYRKD